MFNAFHTIAGQQNKLSMENVDSTFLIWWVF
jgi:hypothetical protein